MNNQQQLNRNFSEDILQWCFSTLGCAELNIDKVLELAQSFGISAVELRTLSGSTDITKYFQKYRQEASKQYRHLVESKFIKMFNTSFCLVGSTNEDFRALLELARLADDMQVPYCRVFGGFDYTAEPKPELINHAACSLKRWTAMKEEYGLQCELALETHDGFSSATNCCLLFEEIKKTMPIVWDVHHTWRYGGETIDESFSKLEDSIVHIHVKDSIKIASGKVKSVLPGSGNVPIKNLLEKLRKIHFNKPVSLEWERLWEPELPPLAEALNSAYDFWHEAGLNIINQDIENEN